MQERTIWNLALLDISEVRSSRGIQSIMPSMSSQELRNAAVQALRIDKLFDNDVIHPLSVKCIPCHDDAVMLEVALGGQVVMIMNGDGTLNLHHTRNLTSPTLTCVRTDHARSIRTSRLSPTYFVIPPRADGELLALVCEYYTDQE